MFAVELFHIADDRLALKIRDDGPEFDAGSVAANSDGLGLSIMQHLAAELGGSLTMEGRRGTTVKMALAGRLGEGMAAASSSDRPAERRGPERAGLSGNSPPRIPPAHDVTVLNPRVDHGFVKKTVDYHECVIYSVPASSLVHSPPPGFWTTGSEGHGKCRKSRTPSAGRSRKPMPIGCGADTCHRCGPAKPSVSLPPSSAPTASLRAPSATRRRSSIRRSSCPTGTDPTGADNALVYHRDRDGTWPDGRMGCPCPVRDLKRPRRHPPLSHYG
jgi:hypothetical protein